MIRCLSKCAKVMNNCNELSYLFANNPFAITQQESNKLEFQTENNKSD